MIKAFETFVEQLSECVDAADLQGAMVAMATALDLPSFAYLSLPHSSAGTPRLISNYHSSWTSHYLRNRYQAIDPVILRAGREREAFQWGQNAARLELSKAQQRLFDEAAPFGIRSGFTIPIHDYRGLFAALTFAADEREPPFLHIVKRYERALQLIAVCFHIHVRRKLLSDRVVDGVRLSPREFECLQWAARGKSAWEIGHILGISRRTAAFHLDNAKAKLGVRSITQAVARLAASKPMIH